MKVQILMNIKSPYIQLHSIWVQKETVTVWGLNKDFCQVVYKPNSGWTYKQIYTVQKTVAVISGFTQYLTM